MNSKDFVELFYKEKENMIKLYLSNQGDSEVSLKINNLNLTTDQMKQIENIIDNVITDIMYTILLGLEGEASIGGVQQTYKLYDESGCVLNNCGDIEQYAYEYFHENK